MLSRILRIVACLVLALVSLSLMPAAASASPGTPTCTRAKHRATHHAQHTVAKVLRRASLRAIVPDHASSSAPVSVDVDDDDDDDSDDDGNTPDPDDFGPTSHAPLPGPSECSDTGFGAGPTGRGAPGTRELPEDPP